MCQALWDTACAHFCPNNNSLRWILVRVSFYTGGFLATNAWWSWDSILGNHTPETGLKPCQGCPFVDCDVSLAGSKAR